ncbi:MULTISPECIES: flagellar hook-associated protein FlgK [Dehalobacter]|jgi:flagellar hook-associated protein 1 FlgK|uniref:Flagellar hook-associated protein 1 n=2 Tax=Dehalobacter restrictus TaxID=55583 RepID=A0A857DKD6_9FIRM|nr:MULTISPECIES: flagellar hook-associated protein FlgK [Dehalobacter]AHF10637.1 flagellar hook protein FlgK [Dehalobacter restrictus DSM 9455]MCG1026391.1 flagellar hook-associated protein FlgK [Dehalobacter sp.]MDJ0306205.1 flagellar hook-associated protein FlgK [Dehalobacter sp.]OCZ54626.1 flagellar hook-associated protein FlgK [Dehalobacter sp. TeCB1]QHA01263.1 flagellar hook-associated protein FlgK [Dehalobacter restrictus]
MYSTFFGLELANRTLSSQQAALGVAGHNISNASTSGYSRQIADLKTAIPLTVMAGGKFLTLGTGSAMDTVTRARDSYLDLQFRSETSKYEYWSGRQSTLSLVESMVNEPSSYSLSNDMNKFWNSWSVLANNPQNAGVRTSLIEQTKTLVDTFHHMEIQISETQNDLDSSVKAAVTQINTLAEQIRSLNIQIKNSEVAGDNPNDLKDQRDSLVDNLSKIVPVRVIESRDPAFTDRQVNNYKVIIGNENDPNNVLVDFQAIRYLQNPPPTVDGFSRVVWADSASAVVDTGSAIGTPLTISDGDQIAINIDGTSYTVDLSSIRGTYDGTAGYTLTDLAANLQTAINNVSGQPDVSIAYTGGHLTITSGTSGGTSLIALENVTGSLGRSFHDPAALTADPANTGSVTSMTALGTYTGKGNTLTATYNGTTSTWELSDNGIPAGATTGLSMAGITLTVAGAPADGDTFTLDLTVNDSMTSLGFSTNVASNWVDLGTNMGQLAANLDMRDHYIESVRSRLDTLAKGIANAVNVLHRTGQGLELETTGIDFFTSSDGSDITAANIEINAVLQANYNRIATGIKTNPLEIGDSSVALAISSLANSWTGLKTAIGQNVFGQNGANPVDATSFGDFYGAMITDLGVNAQQAERMTEGQSVLVEQMYTQREILSGVSLDEEMTNIIKYQKTYSSAARFVTMLDSMFDNLIAMGTTK